MLDENVVLVGSSDRCIHGFDQRQREKVFMLSGHGGIVRDLGLMDEKVFF